MNKLSFPDTKMSFFGVGNPFATPVGQKIEQATDVSLDAEDWALNMEIVDMINTSPEAAKDAAKALRKRLNQAAGKNHTVVMFTLTVLETCVKNCGRQFHSLVCCKEFVNDMKVLATASYPAMNYEEVKLIGPKNDPPAALQEKVLNLIRCWAETFRSLPDMQGVVQVYQELKTKGVEFPAADLEAMAPIITPQRSIVDSLDGVQTSPVPHSPTATNHIANHVELTEQQKSKLRSDLSVVEGNITVMSEMLNELSQQPPDQHHADDLLLLQELSETMSGMQSRVADLVARCSTDEMLTTQLLTINDQLNSLLLRHQRFNKNRTVGGVASPSSILGAAMGVPSSNSNSKKDDDALIDLSDDPPNIANLSLNSAKAVGDVTHDEFDMLAQSRNDNNGTPTAAATQKMGEIDQREIDEIAAWLNEEKQATAASNPQESVTSSDFEKFLAERAAAAENLPNVSTSGVDTSATSPRHRQVNKEDKPDLSFM